MNSGNGRIFCTLFILAGVAALIIHGITSWPGSQRAAQARYSAGQLAATGMSCAQMAPDLKSGNVAALMRDTARDTSGINDDDGLGSDAAQFRAAVRQGATGAIPSYIAGLQADCGVSS